MVEAHNDKSLRFRLDQVLREFASVADLARLIGVSDNAVYKWLSGRGQPSVANLVALAKAAKVSVEWLATGHDSAAPKGSTGRAADQGDFVYVARNVITRSAETGGPLQSAQIVDYLAFKREWVRARLNKDPGDLLLIQAVGDCMAPTLEDSDLLLVDLSEPRFRHDGIYVMRSEDDLCVKRLQRRPDGTLNLISDNPAYESSTVTGESVSIIGRVIWSAGRL